MSDITAIINQQTLESLDSSSQRAHQDQGVKKTDGDKSEKIPFADNPLLAAYFIMHQTVNINQQSAETIGNGLEVSNEDEGNLIRQEAAYQFFTLPQSGKIKTSVLTNTMDQNEEVSAIRDYFTNQLTVLNQNNQVKATEFNTAAQNTNQTLSQASSLLQMLEGLTNQITRI